MSDARSKAPRGEERKTQMLNATLRLIAAGGVDSVTHRRVAEAAGVPLGSTTYHFESREHLLQEAFEHYRDHWLNASDPDARDFADQLYKAFIHAIDASGNRRVSAYWVESRDHRVSIHQSPFDVRIEVASPRIDGVWHDPPCGYSAKG